jgi:ATP-binding cassette subfamily B protein
VAPSGLLPKIVLLVRALPRGGPVLAGAFALTSLAAGVLPVLGIVAVAALVDAVASGTAGLTSPIAFVCGVQLGAAAVGHARHVLGETLGERLSAWMHDEVMAAVLTPNGVAHLEDPEIADEITRMQELESDVGSMTQIVSKLGLTASDVVAGLGALVVLSTFRWWVGVLALVSVVVSHRQLGADEYEIVKTREANAGLARRGDWFFGLAIEPGAAKEIRVFGLAPWIAESFERLTCAFLADVWALRRLRARPVAVTVAANIALTGVAVAALGRAVAAGDLDAGDVARYGQALLGVLALGYGGLQIWAIHQGAAQLPHVFGLATRTGLAAAVGSGDVDAAGMPAKEIVFRSVSFAYPNRVPVLDGLDLTLTAGRSTAIVGANGAGKTTLIKLLTRLYEPAAGEILVDGVDLRDIDAETWTRRLAVLPQQFVRLELTAADNLTLGTPATEAELDAAAAVAGATSIIERLPLGWQTPLSRGYEGGADLSGGEWQRLALARAILAVHRGARILILDEPTASLDVRSEAAFFDDVISALDGVTLVLVSHRFSTVRRADRICVLSDGRVAESGSHDDLIASRSLYAEMFGLQAAAFQDEES